MHDASNVRSVVVLGGDREGSTMIDHIRPTVVVRRRVYDVAQEARRENHRAGAPDERELDEGEPRALSVAPIPVSASAPALASADTLTAVEPSASRPPSSLVAASLPAPQRTVAVGPTIPVAALAQGLGQRAVEVAAELVSRGFFEVTARATITREAAGLVAAVFGFAVEPVEGRERPAVKPRTAAKVATKAVRRAPATKRAPAPKRPRAPATRRTRAA